MRRTARSCGDSVAQEVEQFGVAGARRCGYRMIRRSLPSMDSTSQSRVIGPRSGWSAGVLQAMESEDARFAVGVQWHPETANDPGLFVWLVDAARGRAEMSSPGVTRIPLR
jgi:CTP synthase (UTP-ammonia lyase)